MVVEYCSSCVRVD